MRVTHSMMTENAIRYIAENQERMMGLQDRIASTKQYQQASDNPSAVSQVLSLRSSLQASQSYLDTAQNVDTWMDASEGAFKQFAALFTRATSLVTGALNDTMGAAERANSVAPEIDMLLKAAIDAGNTTHQGNYLFSGFKVNVKPFVLAADESGVSFAGDNGLMKRDLGPGQTISANVDAEDAFTHFYQALISARDALTQNNTTNLRASLGQINAAIDEVSQLRTSNGARQRQVQATVDRMEKAQIELKSLLSQREDTNMVEAISLLRNQETTYQAVLEVGQRAISALNLFDVLR